MLVCYGMKTEYDKDLTGMNTFGMKVYCACFVEYDSVEQLKGVFCESDCVPSLSRPEFPQPFMHIGGGSNLLFTRDFPGTVFHSGISFINELSSSENGEVIVEAGAGVIWDDFCAWCAEKGLWGPENLSGIPGEVGAAAVQNIGAYGVEVCDMIREVRCFDTLTGASRVFGVAECRYGYRDSIFKDTAKGRYIVTSVVFRLSEVPRPRLDYGHVRSAVESAAPSGVITPGLVRRTVTGIRDSKLPSPSVMGSAGSFFKNPVVPKSDYDRVANYARAHNGDEYIVPHYDAGSGFVKIPAAWLIDQCGWKGYREGNVAVYEKQPLVIVNFTGKASPDEVVALENKIVASVKSRFGIELHPEVEHIL